MRLRHLWPDRRTYEVFAAYWGAMADPSTTPIAAALNSRPKYVASTSLADPQWAGRSRPAGSWVQSRMRRSFGW